MTRTPPASVIRILRKEVGFGCPYPGCRNPILTWHHFAPAWHIEHHHRPEGMIASVKTTLLRPMGAVFEHLVGAMEEGRKFSRKRPSQIPMGTAELFDPPSGELLWR